MADAVVTYTEGGCIDAIISQLAEAGTAAAPVVLGREHQPEAVIIPWASWQQLQPSAGHRQRVLPGPADHRGTAPDWLVDGHVNRPNGSTPSPPPA